MKFLFYIGHPAHFLNVHLAADRLAAKGHEIIYVARDKDVTLDLVKGTNHKVVVVKGRQGDSKFAIAMGVLMREIKMFGIAFRHRPDLMAGTDLVITHLGKLLGIPSVVINEDDAKEIPLFTKYAYPYCNYILAPDCCDTTPYNSKKLGYPGYHELAYLHPNHFIPDREKVKELMADGEKYFLLRFSALAGHHDLGKKGITNELAMRLIEILKPHGKVFISSERPLEKEFEPYRYKISPKNMHHALYYAQLYIGDSQTMTAEAAVLGTPALRYNDFVGRLNYLEELEHKYGLTVGCKTNETDKFLNQAKEWANTPSLKDDWKIKREKMLSDMIDVSGFFEWFFENYPASAKEMAAQNFSFDQVRNRFI